MQDTISYVLQLALFLVPIAALIWLGAWVLKMIFLHQSLVISLPFG